ncbi:MAG: cation-translocating P-type ATPase [Chthoniobacteraceae bacterium]
MPADHASEATATTANPAGIAQGAGCRADHDHTPAREHKHAHDERGNGHDHHADEWKLQLGASFVCLALGLVGYFLGAGPGSLACYAGAYLAGAWFVAGEVWELLRERTLDVHFLMLAVAAGAAAIGKWGEGTVLLFLFSFAGALEHFAMARTQNAIESLFHAAPKTATVIAPFGAERIVAVDELTPGLVLRVKPGELFPVDAEVIKGESAADDATLTGEATPVDKRLGDAVLAGTMNLWGAVEVRVLRPAKESALQKIIHLIQHAQRSKAPSQRFTDRFGSRYTLAILSLTVVMFFVWWLGLGRVPFSSDTGEASAFYHAMTLLVVASPCALVLSIPSAILAAIASGARQGILFRGGAAVEELAEVKVVAMDKTGTLTTGELKVEQIESFPAGHEADILRLAASLEQNSTHPLARAIVRHAKRERVEMVEIDDFEQTSGFGLRARVEGKEVRLGRRSWAQDPSHDSCRAVAAPTHPGVSEVWITAGSVCGRVLLRDEVRPQSRQLVEMLHQHGLRTLVLTGDREEAAEPMRAETGIDEVRAGLKPEDKLQIIEDFARAGEKTAMIGDGVNDAPSLAAAHVGVAMGARGSDSALEQAEVVLMHDRLENFLTAYELSRRARKVIRQNLGLSLGVIVVLVVLALGESIPLTIGVLGHEGSTVLVVLNSLRLLRKTPVATN